MFYQLTTGFTKLKETKGTVQNLGICALEMSNKNEVDSGNFVERDGDKVLSTNDYTDAEKALVAQLADDAEGFTVEDLADIFD